MAAPANSPKPPSDKRTPIGVISFPALFTPRAVVDGGEQRYSVNLIFDKNAQNTPEFKQLKNEIVACARTRWGAKADDMLRNNQLRLPIRKASEKSQFAGYDDPDAVFINAWSKQKPDVLDARLNELMASDLFPGCTGRISYNCFAYEQSGNKGIGIGLSHVQIKDRDESKRLDNRKSGRASFDALDTDDDDDIDFGTTKGEDDVIPF